LPTNCNARNTQTMPGMVARPEGVFATEDPSVDEAYEGLGDTCESFTCRATGAR